MASLKKKISNVVSCPTCAAISAVMAAAKVPSKVRNEIAYDPRVRALDTRAKSKVKRKLGAQAVKRTRLLQRALKFVNAKARKKDGSLKKGWSQSRIMKEAHRRVKKELK